MAERLELLMELLRARAHERHACLTTLELSRSLGVSQQTASRWLIQLKKNGAIERSERGIRLTKKALLELRALNEFLLRSLDSKKALRLRGRVISGTKDGRYYLGLSGYSVQFRKKLGFSPYPGTLNVRLGDLEAKIALFDREGIVIDGFTYRGRELGEIKCFPCVIGRKISGFAVLPSRSHYGLDVIELISKSNLRKSLRLKDGDTIELQVMLQ